MKKEFLSLMEMEEDCYQLHQLLINKIDYRINKNLIRSNLINLYQEGLINIEEIIIKELQDIILDVVVGIAIFNNYEKYEYSSDVYNKMLELYIESVMLIEERKLNRKELKEEFRIIFDNIDKSLFEDED